MDFGITILAMGATAAGCWAWQRYRVRLLTVGRRSSWLRRMPSSRVNPRQEAWATPALAGAGATTGPAFGATPSSPDPVAGEAAGELEGDRAVAVMACAAATGGAADAVGDDAVVHHDLGELEALKAEIAELLPEMRRRDDRIAALESRVAERSALAESLQSTVAESQRALQRERDRVTVLEKRREDRAREASLLREEVRSLDNAIGHLNERLVAAQQKAKGASKGAGAEAERVESSADDAAERAANAAEARLAERDETIRSLEARVRDLQGDLEEANTRRRQREQHVERLEANVAEFAKQVNERDQRVSEMTRDLRSARRKAEANAEQARGVGARLSDAQSVIAARDHRLRRISAAYRAARTRLRESDSSARTAMPDDLRRIRGVGAAAEEALRAAGITRFEQLAALTPEALADASPRLATFAERMKRDDWIGQADRMRRDAC